MNASIFNDLTSHFKALRCFRNALLFASVVLLVTQVSPAQDTKVPKIPDGEAQFTPEQLEQYYLVYRNSDVRYLRTLFNAYLTSSGGGREERQALDKCGREYLQSKFVVLSRDGNTFGGTLITIVFQDRPDKVFVAWVYPDGAKKDLRLKRFEVGEFSAEDIRRIKIRYKALLDDKNHAM